MMRQGFGEFFLPLRDRARELRHHWQVIVCGSRDDAFSDYQSSLRSHPDAFNILLVDSEGPVTAQPWDHLRARDRWDPQGLPDDHCHLMVQMMEAWLVADVDALSAFYDQHFHANAIPPTRDVEAIDKARLEDCLQRATRDTQKGEYHKIKHGAKLLAQIQPATVRAKAQHCERLFSTIERLLGS
ncbi:DUF4276 family protein [bacterium]|nr:DUF4276 family protein [bacterium]